MSQNLVIALRLPDKKPSELKFSEMAELLKQFAGLLKNVDDNFGYIQEGSIFVGSVGLSTEAYNLAIENISNSEGGDLDQFLNKHKDWGHAEIGVHGVNESPKNMRILRKIQNIDDKPTKFKQHDVLRGKTVRWTAGKDDTDHIGIVFVDGSKISAKASRQITSQLKNFFGTESLIDFTGEATYCFANDFKLELVDFKIDNVQVLGDISIDSWVDDFVGFGASGWQDFDDPFDILTKERLS